MGHLGESENITSVSTQKIVLTDKNGQTFTMNMIDLERALGVEYMAFSLPIESEYKIPIKGGLYIAKNEINPETVVFSVEDYGNRMTTVVAAKNGSIDFVDKGSYVRISISDDRNYVIFKNVNSKIHTSIRLKRICLS